MSDATWALLAGTALTALGQVLTYLRARDAATEAKKTTQAVAATSIVARADAVIAKAAVSKASEAVQANSEKMEEIHQMVNGQQAARLRHIELLESQLRSAGIEPPPREPKVG